MAEIEHPVGQLAIEFDQSLGSRATTVLLFQHLNTYSKLRPAKLGYYLN